MNLRLMLLCIGFTGLAHAQEKGPNFARNLFLRHCAVETVQRVRGDTVQLDVSDSDRIPFLRQIFSEELLGSGKTVLLTPERAKEIIRVEAMEARNDAGREGDSLYLLRRDVRIGVMLVRLIDDSVIWSKEFQYSYVDTLSAAEHATVHSEADAESSLFSDLLGPLLAAMTGIIIVVLLFTVRGS